MSYFNIKETDFMGTICILLGLIIFLGSIFLGFAGAGAYLNSQFAITFASLASNTEIYILFVGVCAFIGLLICLNLVMLGLTYNKVRKLGRRK